MSGMLPAFAIWDDCTPAQRDAVNAHGWGKSLAYARRARHDSEERERKRRRLGRVARAPRLRHVRAPGRAPGHRSVRRSPARAQGRPTHHHHRRRGVRERPAGRSSRGAGVPCTPGGGRSPRAPLQSGRHRWPWRTRSPGKALRARPLPPLAQPANAWLSARQPRRGPGLQRTHGPHVAAGSAQALRDSWASFILGFASWDWFVTLTFKTDVSRDRARRMFFAWLARLGRSLEDSKAGRPARFRWILAMEDTCAGRVHLHALLSSNGLDDHPRFRWEARWESVGGGLARIYPAVRKAAPYLVKYVAKDGDIDAGVFTSRSR